MYIKKSLLEGESPTLSKLGWLLAQNVMESNR